MAQIIEVPGQGQVEFPDGMSDAQITAAIRRNTIGQAAQNTVNEMGHGQRFLVGAGKAFSDIGQGAQQLFGFGPSAADVTERQARDAPLMNTGAGMAGNIVGNVAATAPAALVPGANTLLGAGLIGGGLGAAQPVGENESRLTNAGVGAAGGALGQAGASLIGRIARPVQSQLDDPLRSLAATAESKYGIPLNAAQKTGSKPLAIIDSVMENLPLTADRQALAKAAQQKAFNKATLGTIGETADQATPDVLNAARTRIGGEFNRLSKANEVTLGNDFLDSLAKVDASRNVFTKPGVADAVEKGLDLAAAGKITGENYQKIRSTLGKQSSDAFRSGNSELGQALKSIKGALDSAADSSISAADKDAWNLARRQWQSLKVVEKAAAPVSADAVSGNVSAAKLAQALQSVDKQGFTYGTRGDDLSELARIGQGLLKQKVPDSGTAQRAFYQRFLENPLSAAWQGGVGGISLPVQMLMNSKAGQSYLGQQALSPQALALARALRQGAGMTGAALPLSMGQQ